MTRTEIVRGSSDDIQGGITKMEEAGWEVRAMVPHRVQPQDESRSNFWVVFWRDEER